MGNSLLPMIRELILDKFFMTFKTGFSSTCLFEYVEGSFCILNNDLIDCIFEAMYNFHDRLSFSLERKKGFFLLHFSFSFFFFRFCIIKCKRIIDMKQHGLM